MERKISTLIMKKRTSMIRMKMMAMHWTNLGIKNVRIYYIIMNIVTIVYQLLIAWWQTKIMCMAWFNSCCANFYNFFTLIIRSLLLFSYKKIILWKHFNKNFIYLDDLFDTFLIIFIFFRFVEMETNTDWKNRSDFLPLLC